LGGFGVGASGVVVVVMNGGGGGDGVKMARGVSSKGGWLGDFRKVVSCRLWKKGWWFEG